MQQRLGLSDSNLLKWQHHKPINQFLHLDQILEHQPMSHQLGLRMDQILGEFPMFQHLGQQEDFNSKTLETQQLTQLLRCQVNQVFLKCLQWDNLQALELHRCRRQWEVNQILQTLLIFTLVLSQDKSSKKTTSWALRTTQYQSTRTNPVFALFVRPNRVVIQTT